MIIKIGSGLPLAVSLALGGLGIFLIAVKLMSNSLKSMSGGYTVNLMKKMSANRFLSLAAGIVFTTIIQSSDGAVALAIGLIAAGFMDLRAAIPFILGANIGTATTSLLVWLGDISFTNYFMILAFVGAMGYLIIKEEKKSNIAMLVFSIGAIFIGLKVLGTGMKAVSSTQGFKDMIHSVSSNNWGAMFTSITMTGLMQSSSATVTVVQSIYSDGSMGLDAAIAMIIGANIGTTFTALITSIGSGRNAKRIAIIWLFTNAAMALAVMPIIGYYADAISTIVPISGAGSAKLELAVSHLMFNSILVFIFIWFIDQLAKGSKLIVRDRKSSFSYDIGLPMELIHTSPALAFEASKKTTYGLAKMSEDSMKLLYKYFATKDKKVYERFKELENLINLTRKNLYSYLIELGSHDISKHLANKHMSLVLAVRSLEKVPVLGHQLAHRLNSLRKRDKKTKEPYFDISDGDYKDTKNIMSINISLAKRARMQLKNNSKTRHNEMYELVNKLEEKINISQEEHIKRVRKEPVSYDYISSIKSLGRMGLYSFSVSKYLRKSKKEREIKTLNSRLIKELNKNIKD